MQDRVGEFQKLYVEQMDKLKKDLEGAKQKARSLSNNSFLETKTATQQPAYSNLDFVVELLTSLHSTNDAYR